MVEIHARVLPFEYLLLQVICFMVQMQDLANDAGSVPDELTSLDICSVVHDFEPNFQGRQAYQHRIKTIRFLAPPPSGEGSLEG